MLRTDLRVAGGVIGLSPRAQRRLIAAVAGASAATLLAAIPAMAEARIVPGKTVAGVSLGDGAAKVKRVLGEPERGSNVLNYRYVKRHGLGVYFIGGKAFEITVLRGAQATPNGIKVGSTARALSKAYPAARCRAAVAGNKTECRLPARFRKKATETLFTVKNSKVVSIAVRFV